MSGLPSLALIIPAHNAAATLEACLRSVFDAGHTVRVIVVDDGSTDASADIAGRFPCVLIRMPENRGAAAARNAGARLADSEVLFFLDSDVVMERGVLARVAQAFADDPSLDALFGSYRAETVPTNFVSVYKNLQHHYTHQVSSSDAITFCGGYGAIRRRVFLGLDGFDESQRALEDIEFGYRLHRAGHRIRLMKDLQFTHLKTYSLASLIRSDVRDRAIPWTRLMLEKHVFRNDLNTKTNNVVSVVLAFGILGAPIWGWVVPRSGLVLVALLMALLCLNLEFLVFVTRVRGLAFGLRTVLMTWLYYVYSGVGLIVGIGGFAWERIRRRR